MQVRLLGTGASDGWPNPWCDCPSCRAAAAAGRVRGQTSALVDGRLLLDVGEEVPAAAARQGVSLAQVQVVLVTHAHPDHHGPSTWSRRGWTPRPQPLDLLAPPAVLAQAQPTLDPGVRAIAARPGEEHVLGGYRIRVLAASHGPARLGPAVLYDVTGPDGCRLLWAIDTGPLGPEVLTATAEGDYDVILLELTSSGLPTHLDLRTWPEQVAALRRNGACGPRTRLLAAHLGHGNPPPDELDAVLHSWGAAAPDDGTVLDLPARAGTPRPADPPSRQAGTTGPCVLVLGGARSGKSAYAEQRIAAEPTVTYLATAPDRPEDADWAERVRRHVDRRPDGWSTVETGAVAEWLETGGGAVLVDDLGLWLTRVLDHAEAWDASATDAGCPAADKVNAACDRLVAAVTAYRGPLVIVAPLVGSGVVPATSSGRLFRDRLGELTARLAQRADEVVEVVAGLPRRLR